MAAEPAFNVSELIDTRPLGALQIRIVVLCTLVALLDGLDLQSIGLAAPGIAADLHIPPPWLSAVFSAALAGLALGAFGFGVLADRVGRKAVLIGATACFGIFTICTALAPSFAVLLAFRFLAGLGLGGAMPSFISLTSEYSPRRLRAVIVALLWRAFRSAALSAASSPPGLSRPTAGIPSSGSAACCRYLSASYSSSRCRNRSAFWSRAQRRLSE